MPDGIGPPYCTKLVAGLPSNWVALAAVLAFVDVAAVFALSAASR